MIGSGAPSRKLAPGSPNGRGGAIFPAMNLYLRLLWMRLVSRLRPACSVLGPVRTPFRVWPTDLDVLRHVNNGVYLSLLDLARIDLIIRSGLAPKLKERGWFPVVAAESIRFRKSLTLFQRFEVETVVLGRDEKAIYVHQRFVRGDAEIASALIAARILRRAGGAVTPDEVLALTEHREAPELPEWARTLAAAQLGL